MLDFSYIKSYEPITVIGHANADADSIISSIFISRYLSYKGILNEIKLMDEQVDNSVNCINIDISSYKKGISTTEALFLVDNSFAFPNPVVACVDHHPSTSTYQKNYINKESSACAKIIYDLMVEDGYKFSNEELTYLCYALFLDTCSFSSSKSKSEDHIFAKEIINQLQLDYNHFYSCGLSIHDLSEPISELCINGIKKYQICGSTVMSSFIHINDLPSSDFESKCIAEIREKMKKDSIPLWVFILGSFKHVITKYIIITEKSYTMHYELNSKQVFSRGQDIIPWVKKEVFECDTQDKEHFYSFIIRQLINNNISISTMESCTSGLFASTITDTEGASKIFKGAFVTYANEAKIKQGVPAEIIEKYGVYSYETAKEMAQACARAYQSDIGIGITGTTGNIDENNADSIKGEIYYGIWFRGSTYLSKYCLDTTNLSRKEIKKCIIDSVVSYLSVILDKR